MKQNSQTLLMIIRSTTDFNVKTPWIYAAKMDLN